MTMADKCIVSRHPFHVTAVPTSTNSTSFRVPPVPTLIVYRIEEAMCPVEVKMAGVRAAERNII